MPRQPKWVDCGECEVELTEGGDLLLIESNGGPFGATPEDARDIASALIAWADKQEGK